MTLPEYIDALFAASDAGEAGVGVYRPHIQELKRVKKSVGLTEITLVVRVAEFTPNDALHGIDAWLFLATKAAREKITGESDATVRRAAKELLFAASFVACDRLTGPSAKGPTIPIFAADASSLTLGTCTVLRWEVKQADTVSIWPEVGEGLELKGSRQVCPKATTTYTLTATGKGAVVTGFASVTVK